MKQQPTITKGTTPIIGVTKVTQVEDAVHASGVVLTEEEIRAIEAAAESTGVNTRGAWEKVMV